MPRRRSWVIGLLAATAASIAVVAAIVLWGGTGGREVASIDDPFGRVAKTARGEVVGLEAFPERWRASIGEMLRTETVSVREEQVESLHVTLGAGPSMYLRPVSTIVRSDRPTFEWKSRGADCRYRVLVYRPGDSQPVLRSGQLQVLRWEAEKPLNRGEDYAWEVEVSRGGKDYVSDEDRPRFRVLDARTFAKIEEQEHTARGSHLVLAVIYLKAALLDEAQRELESLRQDPRSAALAGKLLESLRKHR